MLIRRREVATLLNQLRREVAVTMLENGVDPSDAAAAESSRRTPARPPATPLSTSCDDHWSWNKNDKSHEVRLYGPKQRIAHFHPNWSNGTAGVRGTRALNGGRFYWEINVSQRSVQY